MRYLLSKGGDVAYRVVTRSDGRRVRTSHRINLLPAGGDPGEAFDLAWLNAERRPPYGGNRAGALRLADLFCGAGGMTLGVLEAGRALGESIRPVLAADLDAAVRRAYEANFAPDHFVDCPVETLLDGDPHLDTGVSGEQTWTGAERRLRREIGPIDIAVGGPPCQGHSNLNNHTRRDDPKNLLYGRMARFAEVFRPRHLIIENVHGARHDRGGIIDRTLTALGNVGYMTDMEIVRAEDIGVPQTRHRLFIVASLDRRPRIAEWLKLHSVEAPRAFDWAQTGLKERGGLLDVRTEPRTRTKERIKWLFDNDKYELPDDERPECHQDGDHSYKSVYGRIRGWRTAPTITTGFTVMGQGRFVHPHHERTLTPREGARLQFFPAWFSFGEDKPMSRKELVKLIGNAVPPKMVYVLALELLR